MLAFNQSIAATRADPLPAVTPRPHVVVLGEPVPDRLRCSVILLGNFDILHKGHRRLIAQAEAIARRRGAPLSIMACDPHPREFFAPHTAPFRLGTAESGLFSFGGAGIDMVFRPRFDVAFAETPADSFMRDILFAQLDVSAIVCGGDFRFGHRRGGGEAELRQFGDKNRIEVAVCGEVCDDAGRVSTSRIRKLIETGALAEAEEAIGGFWTTSVRHTGWGNIAFAASQLLPPAGGYRVRLLDFDGNHVADTSMDLSHDRSCRLRLTARLPVQTYIVAWLGAAAKDG